MAIFSVEILQEIKTELFVEASDYKAARQLARRIIKEDRDHVEALLEDTLSSGWIYDGVIDELERVPEGYSIDYREGDLEE